MARQWGSDVVWLAQLWAAVGGVLTAWPEQSDGWLAFEGSSAELEEYAVDCLASSRRSFGAAVIGQDCAPDGCHTAHHCVSALLCNWRKACVDVWACWVPVVV